MNILAHLYLSGGITEIMLGNFMGDFVKGNHHKNYPQLIQQGIMLHREIDTLTDTHQIHRSSRDRFRSKYGLHSGVVVDIVYDHFLALHWSKFHSQDLESYSNEVYRYITYNFHWLPERLKEITPYIIKNNWLLLYKSLPGIERVLTGMANRTTMPDHVLYAMDVIENEYDILASEFQVMINFLIHKVNPELNGKLLELNYNEIKENSNI